MPEYFTVAILLAFVFALGLKTAKIWVILWLIRTFFVPPAKDDEHSQFRNREKTIDLLSNWRLAGYSLLLSVLFSITSVF